MSSAKIDFNQDYFVLFGLERRFHLDPDVLELRYRDLQSAVHPDRFAHLSDQERRLSMQWATRVNEAYRTLRQPLARAQYLLELAGVEVGAEHNTAMSPQFLMEQMEWREAVEEARQAANVSELDALAARTRQAARELEAALRQQIDVDQAFTSAADTVRRMMFLDKLGADIRTVIERLEDH